MKKNRGGIAISKSKKNYALLLFVCIIFISISSASAENTHEAGMINIDPTQYSDIYVSVDGDGDGLSIDNPAKFEDISWKENMHIHVLDGNYNTPFSISENNTVISAVNKDKAVFNYNNGGSTISASNVYLIGLKFTSNKCVALTIKNPSNVLISNINIVNCTFENCEQKDANGAVLEIRGSASISRDLLLTDVNIINSTFNNNRGNHNGPAIYGKGLDKIEIVNCEFKNNYVYQDHKSSPNGGIVTFDASNMIIIINSTFINNTAVEEEGGALYVSSKGLSCEGCTFINNTAAAGGALYFRHDLSTYIPITTNYKHLINNCTFEGNLAIYTQYVKQNAYGGAVLIRDYSIISNCLFKDNTAAVTNRDTSIGGALFLYPETTGTFAGISEAVINCTFINNIAEQGGALFISNKNTLTFNCIFINNTAYEIGGAICESGPATHTTIINSQFIENKARYVGGAVFTQSSSDITIINCTFTKNLANNQGGALQVEGPNSRILNSEFNENGAATGGAIILLRSKNITIDKCTFNKNFANPQGGAIATQAYNSLISNSKFSGNSAPAGGAILIAGTINYAIDNCTFNENYAVQGGGIASVGNNISILNSEFNENSAQSGGGLVISDSDKSAVKNCTFNKNAASNNGGGIEIKTSHNNAVEDSKFNKNTATQGGAIDIQANNNTILNSEFRENEAGAGGALSISPRASNTLVDGCEFVSNIGNQPDSMGGAIMTHSPNATIKNSKFTNNSASRGGAIEYKNDNGIIANCEFAKNKADQVGGAIDFDGNGTIANSTFSDNDAYKKSTIINFGSLSLDNNTIKTEYAEIYNNGTIVSPTTLTVLDNKTVDVLVNENKAITAILVDDNGNKIVGGNLTFTVEEDVLNPDFDEYGVYSSNYTPVGYFALARSAAPKAKIIPVYGNYGNSTQLAVKNGAFRVLESKIPAYINVTAEDIKEGETAKIHISFVSDEVVGNLTVNVGDKQFTIELTGNYTGTIEVPELKPGSYNVTVAYSGDEYHSPAENSTIFKVIPVKNNVTPDVPETKENAYVENDSKSLKTGNPLLALLVALFAIPIIRRKK